MVADRRRCASDDPDEIVRTVDCDRVGCARMPQSPSYDLQGDPNERLTCWSPRVDRRAERGESVSDASEIQAALDPRHRRAFWRVLGWSVPVGIAGSVGGLVFLAVTGLGADWYGSTGLGWFDGHAWWIAVAASAGLVVGLLRRLLHLPEHVPGLIEDLKEEKIEPRWVPAIVAVSTVSLIGGASLGPEVALGQMGGGAGGWIARRRKMTEDEASPLTLGGMAGAFSGLFSSPAIAIVLTMEVARVGKERFQRTFYASLVSSSVGFAIYFAIAGTLFLGFYEVPSYEFEDWHLLAGIALGVLSAILIVVTVTAITAMAKVFSRLSIPSVAKPVIGGLVFGLIGFALPLTNFTGSDQLGTVLDNAGALGVGLLIAILLGKILAYATSSASGFIGGPIFPILFLGGTSGVLVNQIFPGIPLGLAFACMLAAAPGAIVSAPLSMVLLSALMTQVGLVETAPILIAVGTAYLTITAIQALRSTRPPAIREAPDAEAVDREASPPEAS